jgi:hypothetical protein
MTPKKNLENREIDVDQYILSRKIEHLPHHVG